MAPFTCPYCRKRTTRQKCSHCGRYVIDVKAVNSTRVVVAARQRKKNISSRRIRSPRINEVTFARWKRYELEGYPANSEPLGYLVSEFAPFVIEFVNRYNKANPQSRPEYSGWRDTPGIEFIAAESGVGVRYLRYLTSGGRGFIGLSQADKITKAMGHPQLLRTMTTVPNPRWSEKRFQIWTEFVTNLSLTIDGSWID